MCQASGTVFAERTSESSLHRISLAKGVDVLLWLCPAQPNKWRPLAEPDLRPSPFVGVVTNLGINLGGTRSYRITRTGGCPLFEGFASKANVLLDTEVTRHCTGAILSVYPFGWKAPAVLDQVF